jgi:hypothetical protein
MFKFAPSISVVRLHVLLCHFSIYMYCVCLDLRVRVTNHDIFLLITKTQDGSICVDSPRYRLLFVDFCCLVLGSNLNLLMVPCS